MIMNGYMRERKAHCTLNIDDDSNFWAEVKKIRGLLIDAAEPELSTSQVMTATCMARPNLIALSKQNSLHLS